jgi:hypothetical protein
MLLYGLLNSIAFMIDALSSGRMINLGNVVSQACSLVLYIIWAWKLNADGEVEPAEPLPPETEPLVENEHRQLRTGESLPAPG